MTTKWIESITGPLEQKNSTGKRWLDQERDRLISAIVEAERKQAGH